MGNEATMGRDAGLTPSEQLIAQIAQYASESDNAVTRATSASQRVENGLAEAILQGALPAGTWLNEQAVAEAFDVSRTPVREAMKVLSAKQLLEEGPNNTKVVASLSVDDVDVVFSVRETLEALAMNKLAGHNGAALADRLSVVNDEIRQKVTTASVSELSELNRTFHREIWLATKSEYLIRTLDNVHSVLRRLPSSYNLSGAVHEAIQDHEVMINELRSGNTEGAAQAARDHAMNGRRRREKMIVTEPLRRVLPPKTSQSS